MGDHIRPKQISFDSPENIVFFDRHGKNLVWYAQGKPCIDLFDAKGFDPYTGEELQPITPAVVRLFKDCRKLHSTAPTASAPSGEPAIGQIVAQPTPKAEQRSVPEASPPSPPLAEVKRYPRVDFPQFSAEVVDVEQSGGRISVSLRLTNATNGKTIVLSTPGNEACDKIELRDHAGNVYACVEDGFGQVQSGGGINLSPNANAIVTLEFVSKDDINHATGALQMSFPVVVSSFSYGVIRGVWNDYQQTIPVPEASYRVVIRLGQV